MSKSLTIIAPLLFMLVFSSAPAGADGNLQPKLILPQNTPQFIYAYIANPCGVAVDSQGNVYVADTYNNRIQKFNSNGGYLNQWGGYGTGNGQFSGPGSVAVDGQGNVYVLEFNNIRIQKFDSNGVYLGQWGSYGSGNGEVDPVFLDTKLGENQCSRRTGGWHQSGIVAKGSGR